jgi:hypothetical protein
MLTIFITGVIVFLIVCVIMILQYIDDWADLPETIFMPILSGMMGCLLGATIALLIPSVTETSIEKNYLKALNDGQSVHGRFFLGIGSFDGKMNYTYYYKKDDFYILNQIDYQTARVRYFDGQPFVETYIRKRVDGSRINNFSIRDINPKTIKVVFNVPEGTIKNDYHLDAR